jgi:hypothetical protein
MILEPKDGREIMVTQCCLLIKPKDCLFKIQLKIVEVAIANS